MIEAGKWYIGVVQSRDGWRPGSHDFEVWLYEALATGQGRRELARRGRVKAWRRRLLVRGRRRKMELVCSQLEKQMGLERIR